MLVSAVMSSIAEKRLDEGEEPYEVIKQFICDGKDVSFDKMRSKIRAYSSWSSSAVPKMLLRIVDIEEARANAVSFGPYR